MSELRKQTTEGGWSPRFKQWALRLREREEQVFLVLTLLIGALAGCTPLAAVLFALEDVVGGLHAPVAGGNLASTPVPAC